ncbi:MAG: 1,4-dihydroxy-2-naphthoate octaprenyltransferase [Candidatus Methanofastidiosum methylothiophilum]|uniref:1,4-dihydroxy-2-naphthoate octaprenyltransferase n=1 Tax=Candidatus Methanofastidiosum methylothiophilum TaxID=1705564 RepID=A0A150IYS9_9EURY|nr:MAG: 1,4-dihydroxy-2-naphthoate octaprenyltransferase [Candidatus Methanofastidiosum methylthiophilus]NMC76948.1 prenyltransferase [Candidatus Methanofastidiosa archaeon]
MNYVNKDKIISWAKIIRFQFYPMTFLAYTVGALSSLKIIGKFDLTVYILGYLSMFLIEFATVISNEYYDYETDRINKNYSQFTGGSRMLVDGKITFIETKIAIAGALFIISIFGLILAYMTSFYAILILLIGLILGLSYTVPPIKLSYRGLGEIDVGITHSFYIVLAGFLLQSPAIGTTFPWLISIPLFFAVFGAIILAGFPDLDADKKVGKKTLTVLLGQKRATLLSIVSIICSILSSGFIAYSRILGYASILFLITIIQGIALIYLLNILFKANVNYSQINKQLQMALSYIMWFTLIPLLYLSNIID